MFEFEVVQEIKANTKILEYKVNKISSKPFYIK